MQSVCVAGVKSYADHSGIAAFIDNALDLDPNIAALLAVGSLERRSFLT